MLLLLLVLLLPASVTPFCFVCNVTCDGTGYLDVTIPTNPTLIQYPALVWSYMPYVCTLIWIVFSLRGRTTTALYGYLLSGLIAGTNEVFIKRALDRDRPPESCLPSYGAPSTHATFSIAWFAWICLEGLYHRRALSLTTWQRMVFLLALALLPVPWSRTMLKDHSVNQVLAGSAWGLCWASGAFYFMHRWGQKWLKNKWEANADETTGRWMGIKNDYNTEKLHLTVIRREKSSLWKLWKLLPALHGSLRPGTVAPSREGGAPSNPSHDSLKHFEKAVAASASNEVRLPHGVGGGR
ncbi:hypothetical protein TeGR_g13824 [Tetraparma gracilis]|uniref:Phosphatidic acid phosphatase type 2/haloperoxidase domain-containing protein n=1 Tax=Tetraparma gracilis TaxID=2962635 RepID=A0ABQ6N8H3_9STRA|nr:hypothetical protein TeGR_g13824 [Tetraparma gracilis]